MSGRSNVNQESEDLLAPSPCEMEEEHHDNGNGNGSGSEDEDDESDRIAAAALKSLTKSTPEREPSAVATSDSFVIPLRFTKSGRKRAVPFPMKLMKVLTEEKNRDIISWMPSGKSFVIRKPNQFVAEILGQVFKSSKFSSFTRKLARWGFQRHYRGEEAGSFYHELFHKDRLDLCEKMSCHKEEPQQHNKAFAAVKNAKSASPRLASGRPQFQPSTDVTLRETLTPRSSMTGSVTSSIGPRPGFEISVPSLPLQLQGSQAAADINAAIEMEVSRRLKERIAQAAHSRQVLVHLQQRHQQQEQQQMVNQDQQQLCYQLALLQQQRNREQLQQQQRIQQLQEQQQQQFQQQIHIQRQLQLQQQQHHYPQSPQLASSPSLTEGLVRRLTALKFGPPLMTNASFAVKPHGAPSIVYHPQAFASHASGLPPINIQGAKTA